MPTNLREGASTFALALLVTSALLPLVWSLLKRRNVLDRPNHRSSHEVPTPRGGGLAQMGGALVALGLTAPPLGALAGVLGFGALGAVDDFRSIPPRLRLVAQLALSAVVGILLAFGDPALSAPLIIAAALIVLPLVVNAVNFMDGINGISAAQGIVFGLSYAWILSILNESIWVYWALALAGISLAFLPWNWRRRAVLFMGDSGSYLMGAVAGLLALAVLTSGHSVLIALAPIAVYLADVLATLGWRVRRRESLTQAHRDHAYQRLVDSGCSHLWTSTFVAILSLACGLTAVAMAAKSLSLVGGLVIVLVVAAAYLGSPKVVSWIRR